MKKKDWISITIIGAAVGLLIQPILSTVTSSFHVASITFSLRVEIFLFFTILAPVALLVLYWIGKLLPVVYQFGKFAAVGVLNSFVDLGVLNLEILAFGTPSAWPYRVFKGVSFLAATTNSFLWNKYWTFNSQEPANAQQTIKFYSVAFVGFVLNVALASYVFSNVARPASISPNLWANIGALVGVGAAFLWNFTGYKFWVFKKETQQ
jgi:putative flippase GtrA